ncbi:MAG: flagellar hook-associated protein FlgL [Desulfurivibrio sp.]|nr:flagellar hook-associated protein FlgL [Desulfurivibrio sp.]
MRITMQSVYNNILSNLGNLNKDMNQINKQISSGKQMDQISDNPVNLVSALGLRTNISEIGQYQKNIKYGETVINASENSLTQMNDLVTRAKTLAIQQANDSMTPANRENAAQEVRNLWEQAVSLANSTVRGKYIFGGFRTDGYTPAEPAPFVQGARDGYFVHGEEPARIAGKLTGTISTPASTPPVTNLEANDLLINGTGIEAVELDDTPTLTVDGLNMGGADNLKQKINDKTDETGVSASLTTLYAGGAATAPGTSTLSFSLNGEAVNITTGGVSPNQTATDVVNAINAIKERTGVTAAVGDTKNGGGNNSVVLRNTLAGDESAITVRGLTPPESSISGLANTPSTGQSADDTHNTGAISLSSWSDPDDEDAPPAQSFTITTSDGDDEILKRIGLGGGDKGFADIAGDGILRYGPDLQENDLLINGAAVTTEDDKISTIYSDASAAAKANAINNGDYGVSATAIPATWTAQGAVEAGTETSKLTGTIADNIDVGDGDLAINGITTSAISKSMSTTSGYNMERAATVKDVVNEISASTGVTASLTTLTAGSSVDHTASTSKIEFTINGETVKLYSSGTNNVAVAFEVAEAINAVSDQTGVTAARGSGNNGGVANSIVLENTMPGDETAIELTGLSNDESDRTGLGTNGDGKEDYIFTAADANTGQVSFSSEDQFTISSPNNLNDDSILKELGLHGGEEETGIEGDVEDDGKLTYGSTPIYLNRDDLVINDVRIFDHATAIQDRDVDNTLVRAINDKSEESGVLASRNESGQLILTAEDGRNIHLQTSALGEKVTHLNGGAPAPNDQVYFGSVKLWSDLPFKLESDLAATTGVDTETGFVAMGLDGGSEVTGEEDDIAGDGRLKVDTIYRDDDEVRYAGDRNNDIAIKVGQQSTIEVNKNGNDAIYQSGVFRVLKELENFLLGDRFTTATSAGQAVNQPGAEPRANLRVPLNSGETGLELEERIEEGSFQVKVLDHDKVPATERPFSIQVDPENDTLEDIAARLNGLPGLNAAWDDSGYLQLSSTDPERYSFEFNNDSSGLLDATGLKHSQVQASALQKSIDELDTLHSELNNQVSDFGARANRIEVQSNIYMNLELATKENLSELEDTDLTEAIMALKAKETAYQAALSSASRTMKMSLVDFL